MQCYLLNVGLPEHTRCLHSAFSLPFTLAPTRIHPQWKLWSEPQHRVTSGSSLENNVKIWVWNVRQFQFQPSRHKRNSKHLNFCSTRQWRTPTTPQIQHTRLDYGRSMSISRPRWTYNSISSPVLHIPPSPHRRKASLPFPSILPHTKRCILLWCIPSLDPAIISK